MGFGLGLGLDANLGLILYIGGIIAFLLSVLWRPQAGLYYLVPLLPMQTVRYRMLGLPLGQHFVDILLLGVVIGLLLHQNARLIPRTPLNKLLALLAVFYYISLWRGWFFLGGDSPLSFADPRFSDWKNYMVMPILCLLVVATIKDVKQMKILVLLMVLSTLMVNRSYYHTVSDRDLSHFSSGARYAGVLGYAGENGFAAFEAEVLVFMLALYAFEKRTFRKIGILLVILTSGYCLLFSFSRGAYAAVLVGATFLALFKERKLLIGVLAVVIGWQVFLPSAVQERISSTYTEEGTLEPSAADRVSLWRDAWNLFSHEPVLGTGFDTYASLHRVGEYEDTHNYYLKVLVETGALGLLMFLWILGKSFRQGFRLYRSSDEAFLMSLGLGFAAMLVCAMVANLFGDRWTYLQVNGFLWVLLGCTMRAQQILEQPQEESNLGAAPVASLLPSPNRVSPA
jgi:putative inorganic carbon (HCO3(-)) transporter